RETAAAIADAMREAADIDATSRAHPFGSGNTGGAIARHLMSVSLADASLLRKRWAINDNESS
ncbi:MAG: hypothetical protein AAFY46_17245, partial [Planctomycetota bacterium]